VIVNKIISRGRHKISINFIEILMIILLVKEIIEIDTILILMSKIMVKIHKKISIRKI